MILKCAYEPHGVSKLRMRFGEALADLAAAGLAEILIGTPAAGGKALRVRTKSKPLCAARRYLSLPSTKYACMALLMALTWL